MDTLPGIHKVATFFLVLFSLFLKEPIKDMIILSPLPPPRQSPKTTGMTTYLLGEFLCAHLTTVEALALPEVLGAPANDLYVGGSGE